MKKMKPMYLFAMCEKTFVAIRANSTFHPITTKFRLEHENVRRSLNANTGSPLIRLAPGYFPASILLSLYKAIVKVTAKVAQEIN
jgi:hypothetical protein